MYYFFWKESSILWNSDPSRHFFPKTTHWQGHKGKKLFERNYFLVVGRLFCQNTDPGMFHETKEIGLTLQRKNTLYTKKRTENISYFERTINIALFAGWILIVTLCMLKKHILWATLYFYKDIMFFQNSL